MAGSVLCRLRPRRRVDEASFMPQASRHFGGQNHNRKTHLICPVFSLLALARAVANQSLLSLVTSPKKHVHRECNSGGILPSTSVAAIQLSESNRQCKGEIGGMICFFPCPFAYYPENHFYRAPRAKYGKLLIRKRTSADSCSSGTPNSRTAFTTLPQIPGPARSYSWKRREHFPRYGGGLSL